MFQCTKEHRNLLLILTHQRIIFCYCFYISHKQKSNNTNLLYNTIQIFHSSINTNRLYFYTIQFIYSILLYNTSLLYCIAIARSQGITIGVTMRCERRRMVISSLFFHSKDCPKVLWTCIMWINCHGRSCSLITLKNISNDS